MPVTVRDLEVAQVLAREVKAAAARSAQASLRADQVKLLFGAPELDAAERERIQSALEMVGLEPQPSLLEVDADAPVAFVTRGGSPRPRRFGSAAAGTARRSPRSEPAERGEFPTVGEFARSTFERARRRLAERDGEDAPPGENAASNGSAHAEAHDFDYEPPAASGEDEPPAATSNGTNGSGDVAAAVDELKSEGAGEPEEAADEREAEVDAAAAAAEGDEAEERPPLEQPEAEADSERAVDPEATAAEAELPAEAEVEDLPPQAESERAIEPEATAEDPAAQAAPRVAVEDEQPELEAESAATAPEPQPVAEREHPAMPPVVGRHRAEIAAVLIAAATLPVIGTSIAGWRFGLPYLALTIAAAGWLVAKARVEEGWGGGVVRAVRSSPVAVAAFRVAAILTVASAVAAVLLSSASTDQPAATKPTPAALGGWTKPVVANAARIKATAPKVVTHRHGVRHVQPAPAPQPATPQPGTPPASSGGSSSGTPTAPAPNGTQGLIEVPSSGSGR